MSVISAGVKIDLVPVRCNTSHKFVRSLHNTIASVGMTGVVALVISNEERNLDSKYCKRY